MTEAELRALYERYIKPLSRADTLLLLELIEQGLETARVSEHRPRVFGSGRGLIQMSPDFDAPLEDFAEYT